MSAFVLIVSAVFSIFGGLIFTTKVFSMGMTDTSSLISSDLAQHRANLRSNFFFLALTFLQFANIALMYLIVQKIAPSPSDKTKVENMEPQPKN